MCRLQRSANQTFASGKFHAFINILVGRIYFGASRADEWKAHSLSIWAPPPHKGAFCARRTEFADWGMVVFTAQKMARRKAV
jgi:hypothetical protein